MAVSIAAPVAPAVPRPGAASRARPLASVGFDWAIVAVSTWFVGGLFLDGWAHNTIPSLETFFTPWHAVLYSGFLVSMAVLGWGIGRNRTGGQSIWQAVPAGYELSLLGGLLFAASGLGDMVWHIVFGIEANLEALLSPTHLLLLFGGTLFITGPIRAAARRDEAGSDGEGRTAQMPRVLAITYALGGLAFFTQFANPWGGPWFAAAYRPITGEVSTIGGPPLPGWFLEQGLSVAGILVQSALLGGAALLAVRAGRVPAGGFTLMFGLYTLSTVLMRQKYELGLQLALVVAALVAGAAADLVYTRVRAALADPATLRAFIAVLPALATTALIIAVAVTQGLWWTIHLWAGAVVLSAAVGWLLAYLATSQPRQVAISTSLPSGSSR
jgi:hypothetical protein